MGYLVGAHAFWIVLGEIAGVAAAWLWVARPFKEATDRLDSITVPDYLEDRFDDRRHALRLAGAAIILSMAGFYTAAQFTAAGKAFESFLGTSYATGVWIGAAIILFYTTIGGFRAVAYSDLLQGLLMFGCLLLLPIVGLAAAGGVDATLEALRAQDPSLLRPMGSLGRTPAGIASAAGFVAIGLAFLGSPQLLTRFIAARDTREIRRGGPIAIACIVVFDIGAVTAGMAGRALFPGLPDHETIYPVMGGELFPAAFTGLFLVIVLAAIMSTVDSLLLLASSAVVRDAIQKVWRPHAGQRALALAGKATTVVLGLGAVVLALTEARVIFWFVLFAWSGLACAFTPPVLCGLFWKGTTRAGALAGMVAGFVVTVAWVLWVKDAFYSLYEMIPGMVAGFGATFGVCALSRGRPSPDPGGAAAHRP
jgi:sodium/proline symporter